VNIVFFPKVVFKIKHRSIKNYMKDLNHKFIEGVDIGLSLCNKIYNYYTKHEKDYIDDLEHIKKILTNSKITKHDILINIKNLHNLTNEQIILIIRYINIINKGKYLLLINDELVYTPDIYKEIPIEIILHEISVILDKVKKERNKQCKNIKLKRRLYRLINNYKRLLVMTLTIYEQRERRNNKDFVMYSIISPLESKSNLSILPVSKEYINDNLNNHNYY